MELIFGVLSRRALDSFLLPQNALLLLTGFPDARQAAVAATNFIVNVRRLKNGAQVAVTGSKRTVGQLPAIDMSDINLSGTLSKDLMLTADFQEELSAAEPAVKAEFQKRVRVKTGRANRKAARKKGPK